MIGTEIFTFRQKNKQTSYINHTWIFVSCCHPVSVAGNASTLGSSGVAASGVDCDLAVAVVADDDYVGCGVDGLDTVVVVQHCCAQEHLPSPKQQQLLIGAYPESSCLN